MTLQEEYAHFDKTGECRCTLAQRMVGEGCEICNPRMGLMYAKETISDLDSEIRRLEAEVLDLNYKLIRACVTELCGGKTETLRKFGVPISKNTGG